MPEYLAPGVYVEEIDTGSKPIEGVSTSTAGMIGVTERGPVDVPILVTSTGEFTRWFGERLNVSDYSNALGPHCFLPHAVEGFFTNGGKRLFITRILDSAGAVRASFDLHDRGANTSAATRLLRSASEATGIAGSPIYVLNVNQVVPATGTLANGDRVRVGNGSDAEFRDVANIIAAASTTHVPLSLPLSRAHATGITVDDINRVPIAFPSAALTVNLDVAVAANANEIDLVGAGGDTASLAANDLLEIGDQFSGEHRFIRSVTNIDGTRDRIVLDSPLALDHDAGIAVSLLESNVATVGVPVDNNALATPANAGDSVAYVVNRNNNFDVRTELVIIDIGNNATREARRIGALNLLSFSTGSYGPYNAGTIFQRVDLNDDAAVAAKNLTADARAGSTVIALDNRVGLNVGDVIRIGNAPDDEYAEISALPNPSPGGAPPNAGNVLLTYPLNRAHLVTAGAIVCRQDPPVVNFARPASVAVLDVDSGTLVPVTDGTGFVANEFVRATSATGQLSYHRLDANAAALDARPVELGVPLSRAHRAGADVGERAALMTIQALDAGIWGNRLRVSVVDEDPGLVARTSVGLVIDPTHIRLASAAGVEAGTILEVVDQNRQRVGDLLKVVAVNRVSNFTITLAAPGITVAQSAAGLIVRSREFRLTVYLLRQPDVALPSRDETVIDSEIFRNLSMDPRHSRYAPNIVGDINGNLRLYDRRPEGESWYVRTRDLALDLPAAQIQLALDSSRLGPETLVDTLPSGRQRPARHALEGGNDSMATLTDATYIGVDDPEPVDRTGLQSMRNEDDVSIVACPGQTRPVIQNALINHCELMRYRFAVLDGERPPNDTLTDVQTQRQQFDTKYAALYHPWLLIPDPFPTNLANIADYPVPPSGHTIGVYARTDIERGVHKAPANEVVRGILGLQRILNKEQQDILNPFPVNINVIRDFRENNRGIRVWGGRVITSDSDWKYVNVRRLLIFIENSIDRGLQWVVFEPNADPLWARVRRTISDFLTVVWRNGALEGTKKEEAFFVKCDRTTMTQTDIDSGRLIVVIGVAPVKPAEFVIIRIGLFTAHADN